MKKLRVFLSLIAIFPFVLGSAYGFDSSDIVLGHPSSGKFLDELELEYAPLSETPKYEVIESLKLNRGQFIEIEPQSRDWGFLILEFGPILDSEDPGEIVLDTDGYSLELEENRDGWSLINSSELIGIHSLSFSGDVTIYGSDYPSITSFLILENPILEKDLLREFVSEGGFVICEAKCDLEGLQTEASDADDTKGDAGTFNIYQLGDGGIISLESALSDSDRTGLSESLVVEFESRFIPIEGGLFSQTVTAVDLGILFIALLVVFYATYVGVDFDSDWVAKLFSRKRSFSKSLLPITLLFAVINLVELVLGKPSPYPVRLGSRVILSFLSVSLILRTLFSGGYLKLFKSALDRFERVPRKGLLVVALILILGIICFGLITVSGYLLIGNRNISKTISREHGFLKVLRNPGDMRVTSDYLGEDLIGDLYMSVDGSDREFLVSSDVLDISDVQIVRDFGLLSEQNIDSLDDINGVVSTSSSVGAANSVVSESLIAGLGDVDDYLVDMSDYFIEDFSGLDFEPTVREYNLNTSSELIFYAVLEGDGSFSMDVDTSDSVFGVLIDESGKVLVSEDSAVDGVMSLEYSDLDLGVYRVLLANENLYPLSESKEPSDSHFFVESITVPSNLLVFRPFGDGFVNKNPQLRAEMLDRDFTIVDLEDRGHSLYYGGFREDRVEPSKLGIEFEIVEGLSKELVENKGVTITSKFSLFYLDRESYFYPWSIKFTDLNPEADLNIFRIGDTVELKSLYSTVEYKLRSTESDISGDEIEISVSSNLESEQDTNE